MTGEQIEKVLKSTEVTRAFTPTWGGARGIHSTHSLKAQPLNLSSEKLLVSKFAASNSTCTATPRNLYNKTKSRYSAEVGLSSSDVRQSRLFTVGTNAGERSAVVEQIKGFRDDKVGGCSLYSCCTVQLLHYTAVAFSVEL
jgi:hypothetical protein